MCLSQTNISFNEMQFLKLVAQDILKRFHNDLSDVVLVFPNIRSSIFFDKYISQISDEPIFSPKYEDLQSLFSKATSLTLADDLLLVSILYKVYIEHFYKNREKNQVETFDEFLFFGEILLSDFNDIDNYLIDPSLVYQNIYDLEQLSDKFEHLTSEQVELLNRFFVDIKTNRTQLKDNFLSIWSVLKEVYNDFKNILLSKGLAYSGMICRDVVENISANVKVYDKAHYVFVGFNVLSPSEEALLEALKDKSLFYWDCDDYYTDNQVIEAGQFIRKNIQKFPQATAFDTNNIAREKNISIVSAATDVAQVGYIPTFINSLNIKEWDNPDTAIVFCNEQMLLPALWLVPEEVDKVNVTMGFPINQTPIYDFVLRLLELQRKGIANNKFYYPYVISILEHHYTSLIYSESQQIKDAIVADNLFYISPEQFDLPILRVVNSTSEMVDYLLDIVEKIGVATKDTHKDFTRDNLMNEAVFRVFCIINRLADLIKSGYLDVTLPTFVSLLKRLLNTGSVPFHGEPAMGLQMMGMLETRNLDFKNLLVVSINEGIMPKVDAQASFIPYFIRKNIGMNTLEYQDSIFAYYFYRLLQRSENITFLYSTSSKETSKSEMSRFLMQILTELPYCEKIKRITLQNDIQPTVTEPITIEKTPEILKKLRETFSTSERGRNISPSALNTFIDCPFKFYLQYVEDIRVLDEFTDKLDNKILGTIIHRTIELIYRKIGNIDPLIAEHGANSFAPFDVCKLQIDSYIDNRAKLEEMLEMAFSHEYFKRSTPKSDYNGEQLIYFDVAYRFIIFLLRFDAVNAPFTIVSMEDFCKTSVKLTEDLSVNIGGYIDRIRLKNNTLFVDDYKTSNRVQECKDIPSLFDNSDNKSLSKTAYVLQSLYYASVISKKNPDRCVTPLLLYLPRLRADEIPYINIKNDKIDISDFRRVADDFEPLMIEKLKSIFDPNQPFSANRQIEKCRYCDFKKICGIY